MAMRLEFSPEDLAFQGEVRAFLATAVSEEMRAKTRGDHKPDKADYVGWQRILHARGWGAPSWPQEYGGTDWTVTQRYIFEEECAAADAPLHAQYGLGLIGPVLYTFGSDEQKQKFLPGIVSGETWWCQGYGAMDLLRDTTLAYLRERRQFGRPLAQFQVLQHRVADMHVACEEARSLMMLAHLRLDAPRRDRVRAVSAAKARVGELGRWIAHQAIQLHGAMEMCEEVAVGRIPPA